MVHFIKATDLQGNPKHVGTHLSDCPTGDWLYGPEYLKPGYPIMFVYDDGSDKMMRSSDITNVNITKLNRVIKYRIETRNTIYYFEEENNE